MLLSNLFNRQKTPPPRFAPGLFLGLLLLFVILGQAKPIFGLVGIGTLLIIAGVAVEINRNRIWEMYKKSYRKQAGVAGVLNRPSQVYFNINVYLLWPFILFLGIVCLYAAYVLS